MSPALIPFFSALAAILATLLALWSSGVARRGSTALAAFALGLALIVALSALPVALTGEAIRARAILPGGVEFGLRLDTLALVFLVPMLIAALASVLVAGGFFERESSVAQVQPLLLAAVAALALVILADRIWLAAAGWFLATLFTFVLIWRSGDHPGGMAAAAPGLLYGLLAGGFLFTGLSHLATLAGDAGITVISHRGAEIRASGQHLVPAFLILTGALAGSGLVPFRKSRSCAIYAPGPVLAFLLPAGPGLAALYLLARLAPAASGAGGGGAGSGAAVWGGMLTALVGLSVLVAGMSALSRRGLAGIAEAVLTVLLALAFWLVGQGATGAMALLVMAMVPAGSALLICAGLIRLETGSLRLAVPGGLINRMPLTALIAGLSLIALCGMAPFAGWHALTALLETSGAALLPAGAGYGAWIAVALVVAAYALIFAALLHSARLAKLDAAVSDASGHVSLRDARPALLLMPALLVGLTALAGLFPGVLSRLAAHTALPAMQEGAGAAVLTLWPGSGDIFPWLWFGSVGLGFLIDGLRPRVRQPRLRPDGAGNEDEDGAGDAIG